MTSRATLSPQPLISFNVRGVKSQLLANYLDPYPTLQKRALEASTPVFVDASIFQWEHLVDLLKAQVGGKKVSSEDTDLMVQIGPLQSYEDGWVIPHWPIPTDWIQVRAQNRTFRVPRKVLDPYPSLQAKVCEEAPIPYLLVPNKLWPYQPPPVSGHAEGSIWKVDFEDDFEIEEESDDDWYVGPAYESDHESNFRDEIQEIQEEGLNFGQAMMWGASWKEARDWKDLITYHHNLYLHSPVDFPVYLPNLDDDSSPIRFSLHPSWVIQREKVSSPVTEDTPTHHVRYHLQVPHFGTVKMKALRDKNPHIFGTVFYFVPEEHVGSDPHTIKEEEVLIWIPFLFFRDGSFWECPMEAFETVCSIWEKEEGTSVWRTPEEVVKDFPKLSLSLEMVKGVWEGAHK